jgi:UDP-N-acetylglucosamine 2-epimerase
VKVLSVVGNRPQFIKSAAVSEAFLAVGVDEVVVHTGQHWDNAMSEIFFAELGLAEPAHRLDLRTADPGTIRPGIAESIAAESPDLVVVFGDTNTTLAGAQAAVAAGVPVAHVESGLRSGDLRCRRAQPHRGRQDRRRALRSRRALGGERCATRRSKARYVVGDDG